MTSESRKILIVDDDADFLEAVSSFLESRNYSVLRARDGHEGLKLAKLEHPDLIIMDIMMTERTEGFFAIHDIRRTPELEEVPILVLSSLWVGVTDFDIPPGSDWLGHDTYLPKPVDMNELLREIRLRTGEDAGDDKSAGKGSEES